MKLWNVDVYSRYYGWDTYTVSANSRKEAFDKCRERLNNETDYPERWVMVDATELKGWVW